jgi:type II secretory pathway pseudopilin PulG
MRALFFIAAFLFMVACGEKPQPNQDLLSAYELLKKGELNAAKLLAEKSERKTEADDALFNIVRGAVAAATLERTYSDSTGIAKSILFFDGDDEKLAWAHIVMGEILYNAYYWDEAAVEFRTAELLAENSCCSELKFLVYNKLSYLNLNSYNWENYDEFVEKLKKYAVSNFDKSQYCYQKIFGFRLKKTDMDSAKFYAQKAVEYIENEAKFYANIYVYYEYADLICDEDDILAERLVLKSFETAEFRQAYSLLGRIYLKRGDEEKAKLYFEKSSKGSYWVQNEDRNNRLLHEYYAAKKDYSSAYDYALRMACAKDSLLDYLQYDTTKVTQVKFADDLEKLKLESALQRKILLIVLIAAVLLAVLISALFYQKSKLAERQRKISEAQQTINSYNQKISELTTQNQTQNAEEIDFLRQKVKALELKFSEIYVSGKNLYAHVLADNRIGRWSKEDYRNFIDYYQSLEFLYVRSFETDFVSLTDRQKIFLILCHIGKTKEQIMQIMTLEESSFRSLKSRIEGQKK